MANRRCFSLVPSPPSRGAWIEIGIERLAAAGLMSPPSRGAWIEIYACCCLPYYVASPPSRGAWIEINVPWFQAVSI